jgi:ArsR family transcriptional regulator
MTAEERDEEQLRRLSVLAEPMRMKILRLLSANKSLRAKDILEEFSVTQPTLSHHMNILMDSELVRAQKDGRCIWYSINTSSIKSLTDMLSELADGRLAVSSSKAGAKAKKGSASSKKASSKVKPALKVDSSVPKPKTVVESPDIEELKKKKDKKKKSDKKKKDKEKDKKKKK